MPTALITGASRGLGHALAAALAERGWSLIINARGATALDRAAQQLRSAGASSVDAISGDVANPSHRARLRNAVEQRGSLDLLVNNASVLGPSPQPALADYPLETLERVYAVNAVAPLALAQDLLPALRAASGTLVNVSSDAAVEPYEGWGGYGSSKAALDQLSAILAVEEQRVRVYAFDPGDMRTQLHQQAFPDDDISDRPDAASVVPALLRLIDERPGSGRFRVGDLTVVEAAAS